MWSWEVKECLHTAFAFSLSTVIILEPMLALDDRNEVPFGAVDDGPALALFFDLKSPSKMLEPPSKGERRDRSLWMFITLAGMLDRRLGENRKGVIGQIGL